MEVWIGWMGFAGTMLLVAVGLLNFSVFREQLRIAREQIDTALRQLELAQQQPDMHLIERATTEASNHVRLLVERPYLRPYFYDDAVWRPGEVASEDEVKAMSELILNNFASALMHSAAFPQYPVRGIDRTIMFHMRHSPALRDHLMDTFDRFPFTGLTILCLKNETEEGVEADLRRLIEMAGPDRRERERREELLQIFHDSETHDAMEFTALSMQKRR
jgi:hypothetical protein